MLQNTSPLWPQLVHEAILNLFGKPMGVQTLGGGQSQANVWRVHFLDQSFIVKRTKQPRESLFYTIIAPMLREAGIPLPHLEWSGAVADDHWLILEDVPTPLPRTRWHADLEVLAVLRRLHESNILGQSDLSVFFPPSWSADMTQDAVACFPGARAGHLSSILRNIQQAHQYLFAPQCWISGDPNPTNWGVRRDGTVVLYDWERFGKGTPAIDLAITVPGLGEVVTFRAVVDGYLSLRPHPSLQMDSSKATFVHDVIVAKIWTVTEYLSAYSRGALAHSATIDALIQRFPEWLDHIFLDAL